MKLLNLDELVEFKREVSLFGEVYPVAEQSIGMMLDAISAAERAKSSAVDDSEMFKEMVKTCQSVLPDTPEEVIRKMSLKQMVAVIEFATAPEQEVVEGSESEVDSEEGKPE